MNSPEAAAVDAQVWVRDSTGKMVPLGTVTEPEEPEVEHITMQVAYRWDCPKCMLVHYTEFDMSHQTVECDSCDTVAYVTDVR